MNFNFKNVVMPNHIHGIIIIVGANHHSPQNQTDSNQQNGTSNTIGAMIRGFKIGVTKWMQKNTGYQNIWQRNYHEHIIRDEQSLGQIREYIVNNPSQWEKDSENPACVSAKTNQMRANDDSPLQAIHTHELEFKYA